MSGKTILVLGLELDERDEPLPELTGRLQKAASLYEPGDRVIVSGGTQPGHRVSEASVMAEKLIDLGIPETCILQETESLSTRENLENAAALTKGETRITAVTSDYHVIRVRLLARKLPAEYRVVGSRTPGGAAKLRLWAMEGCFLLAYGLGWEKQRPEWITRLFNAVFSGHAR